MPDRPLGRDEAGQPDAGAPHGRGADVDAADSASRLVARAPTRRPLAAAAFLALALLAGCGGGGPKNLNIKEGEQLLQEQLIAKTGVPIDRVECPARKVKKGDVFDCTAFFQSQTLRIKVTQTDGKGTILGEPQQAILDMSKATDGLASSIRSQTGVAIKVGCGDRPYLIEDVGSTFDCQLTNPDGTTRRVVVTVTSLDGSVDFRVV